MRVRTFLAAGAPAAAAAIGSIGSRRAPAVYGRLEKPAWAPPAAVFGPVWTALYGLIGFAGWRMSRDRGAAPVWALHGGQLALNAAWPSVFFAAGQKRASLAVISSLDAVLAAEVATLARRDPVAAGALAPYLAWSLFATALNAAVSDPSERAPRRRPVAAGW